MGFREWWRQKRQGVSDPSVDEEYRRANADRQLAQKVYNAKSADIRATHAREPENSEARQRVIAELTAVVDADRPRASGSALTYLAYMAWRAGDSARAQQLHDQVIERYPQYAGQAHRDRARAKAREGDVAEATRSYDLALPTASSLDGLSLADEYATFLEKAGEPDRAREVLSSIIDPSNIGGSAAAVMLRAELDGRQSRYEEADRALTSIIELGDSRDSPEAAFRLGTLRHEHGLPNAEAVLEQAGRAGNGPYSAKANFQLGHMYTRAGEIEKARLSFARVVEAASATDDPPYDVEKLAERAQTRINMLPPAPEAPRPDASAPAPEGAEPSPSEAEPSDLKTSVFISHASEDKASVARPLAAALTERGWDVWLDEDQLKVGDSLVNHIDDALAKSRFGVVILSPNFFKKSWPRAELDALVNRQLADENAAAVLPVWHEITHKQVAAESPMLAGRLAAFTSDGIGVVADRLDEAMKASGREASRGQPRPLVRGVQASPRATGTARPTASLELLDVLKRMLPGQLDEVIFRIGIPQAYVPAGAPSQRAITVLQYVGDERLPELKSAIDAVTAG